jgi:hypothetical protein
MIRKAAILLVVVMNLPMAAGERLAMRVSPATAMAPALLTVQAIVESNPDNRMLEVVAQSADYYRGSAIDLDGERAAHLNVFEFRNLPMGRYEVTSTLVDASGQRVSTSRWFHVARAPGSR